VTCGDSAGIGLGGELRREVSTPGLGRSGRAAKPGRRDGLGGDCREKAAKDEGRRKLLRRGKGGVTVVGGCCIARGEFLEDGD